jgi:hypothetical protein
VQQANAHASQRGESLSDFLDGSGALEAPAETWLVFPDHSKHPLWVSNNHFADGVVYWLLDADNKHLEMVWFHDSEPVYFGPDTELLKRYSLATWPRTGNFPGKRPD